MNKITKSAIILSSISLATYLTYDKISKAMFEKTFKRNDAYEEIDKKCLDFLSNSKVNKVTITSLDGLKLRAYRIFNHDNKRYIILVHGLHQSKKSMLNYAYEFDKLGYNLLVIDQRSSGESEGDYYYYGQKEAIDILQWITYLKQKDEGCSIALFGVSMGASSIMLASNLKLPENVKCLVEDSGYASLKEELQSFLEEEYNIKYSNIILSLFENKMKQEFNINYEDINVKKALESNTLPIMFIHSKEDKMVPYNHSLKLYNHNNSIKKFYSIEFGAHVQNYKTINYFKNINEFISKYM